ncbi:MAG: HAD-IA family hydrolase [Fusobacteria bacterium]|nr:HAD-IA family hydrolase [Fusobacteriota bacterium]
MLKTNYNNILFDLDGTITDSKDGIFKSLRYAFDKLGEEQPEENFLMSFLGPPLWDSFTHKLGYDQEKANLAVAYFRERFQPLGIYENKLYPGIKELLHMLSQRNDVKIYLATAKPLQSAIKVIEYFKIDKYFNDISGATFDGAIKGKSQVIGNLLNRIGEIDKNKTIMIGDRDHDVMGAKENGIVSAGVLYGYGSKEELLAADYIAKDIDDLKNILLQVI